MQITSNTKTEINTAEVEFNIGAEDFENSVQSAFLKKRRSIAIPGFRKGKATRKMIEANYGAGIFYEDAVNDLYRNFLPKLIDELNLDIVDAPDVAVTEISKENGVSFKVTFTIKPEVEISGYKGIEVELDSREVTEEDIDAAFENVRTSSARIIDSSDSPAANGDIIKFDFNGFLDGKPFNGGSGRDYELEIGSGSFIPGFEEQIIGKKVGENFEVDVTFPEDYFSDNLKGQRVLFKCKINEKSTKEMEEIDDEFVKDISEFDTVEEYRCELRRKLTENNEKIRDGELEYALARKLSELMDAIVPDVMYENRIDEMSRDWAFKYNMNPHDFAKRSGMSYENYRDGFREIAEVQVKFGLCLERIAEIEDIQVTAEEIDERLKKMSSESVMPIEKVREIVSEDTVVSEIKTEKALELIKKETVIKEPATKEKGQE
ncbi:MAG: trigger factor [Oscillospiraceae bacterium]|nr:trigger factor [Oscillospiraceae bacterium]